MESPVEHAHTHEHASKDGKVVRLKNLITKKKSTGLHNSVLLIQSIVRSWIVMRRLAKQVRTHAKRARVLAEMVQVEKLYVKDLRNTIKVFQKPLLTSHIVTPKESKMIFGTTEELWKLHSHILSLLLIKTMVWNWKEGLSDVYEQLLDNYPIYQQYIDNFQRGVECIALKKSDKSFAKFLQTHECTKKTRHLDLQSLLIQPVQMILRYSLLLKEYIKFTPESHEDYKPTMQMIDRLRGMSTRLNESKRHSEHMVKWNMITNEVEGVAMEVFSSQSEFVLEGDLLRVKSFLWKMRTYLFLFKDMIIYADGVKIPHKETHDAPISFLSLLGFPPAFKFKLRKIIRKDKIDSVRAGDDGMFLLVVKSKEYIFVAPSVAKREVWVNAIQQHLVAR